MNNFRRCPLGTAMVWVLVFPSLVGPGCGKSRISYPNAPDAPPADSGTADAQLSPDGTPPSDSGTHDGNVSSDATPETTPEADAAPDATPDAQVDAAPDATPDAQVDAAPDATPDAQVDAAPDATDGGDGAYVATCQEWHDEDPSRSDGEVTLYLDHDPDRPWTAYCADMESTPVEYLVLSVTGNDVNFAQYSSSTANVRTVYTRLRFDPVTREVDTADQTFSSSSGRLFHSGTEVSSMPYAVAMNCTYGTYPRGVANINLTGTPFRVDDAFVVTGSSATGQADMSEDGQVVDLSGGGFCGWIAPSNTEYNPFNQTGGTLQLAYIEP